MLKNKWVSGLIKIKRQCSKTEKFDKQIAQGNDIRQTVRHYVGLTFTKNILNVIIWNIQIFTVWINYQYKLTNAQSRFHIDPCSLAPPIKDINFSQSETWIWFGSFTAWNSVIVLRPVKNSPCQHSPCATTKRIQNIKFKIYIRS